MSGAPEGYEPLADDGVPPRPQAAPPTAQQPPPQQQPTFTQPLAGQDGGSAAQGGPVLGVPVYQQPAVQHPPYGRQQDFHSFPPYMDELPPSAEAEWDRAAVLMSIWLGCSVATLALSTLTFNVLAMLGALCATVGAATHRFPSCRPSSLAGDLGSLVGKVFGLAIAATSLSSLVALLSLLIAIGLSASCGAAADPAGCAQLTEVTMFYAAWFSAFAALNIVVVRRTNRMRNLLNPVSAGVVNIA